MLLEFVGCYMDQRSRTLNEKDTRSSSMTVDKCRKTCTSLKYKYYGVEVRIYLNNKMLFLVIHVAYEGGDIAEKDT